MSFPPKLKAKYLARFDELVAEGRAILPTIIVIPPHSQGNVHVMYTTYRLDFKRLTQWKTCCLSLFEQVVSKGNTLSNRIESFRFQIADCGGCGRPRGTAHGHHWEMQNARQTDHRPGFPARRRLEVRRGGRQTVNAVDLRVG